MSKEMFKTKLTDQMKQFIITKTKEGLTGKDILAALKTEFQLADEDLISLTRVNQIKRQTLERKNITQSAKRVKTTSRKTTTDDDDDEVNETESEDGDDTTTSDADVYVNDLQKVLKTTLGTRKNDKIKAIMYNYNSLANPSPWHLSEILTINGVNPNQTREIILNFYGLETVNEMFPSASKANIPNGLANKTVHDDPIREVDTTIKKRIERLNSRLALKELESMYDEFKTKDTDDPLKNLQRRLEFEASLKQLESMNNNNAITMVKELKSLFQNEVGDGKSTFDMLRTMKELNLLPEKSKDEQSPLVQLLQTNLTLTQNQLRESQNQITELNREITGKINDFQRNFFELQLSRIKDSSMNEQQWMEAQERYRNWAINNGFIPKDSVHSADSREEAAFRRFERILQGFETVPDKLNESARSLIDSITTTFDKLASIQDKRLSQQEERQRRLYNMSQGNNYLSQTNVNDPSLLDHLENALDNEPVSDPNQWRKYKDSLLS